MTDLAGRPRMEHSMSSRNWVWKAMCALLILIVVLLLARTVTAESLVLTNELWRIDLERDLVCYGIDNVLMDEEFFLVDNQSAIIHVYSPDGQRLRSLHVHGEGPGQVAALVDVCLMPDGHLGLLSPMGPRVVVISRQGDPVLGVECYSDVRGMSNCYHLGVFGSKYILAGEQSFQGNTFLAVYNSEGYREVDVLSLPMRTRVTERVYDERDDFLLSYRPWVVASNGMVYFATQRTGDECYTIEAVDVQTGAAGPTITHLYQSQPNRPRESLEGWTFVASEYAPDVLGIHEHLGYLWVETSEEGWTYDVFDLEGHYVKEITVTGADATSDLYLFESLAVVVGSEEVVCYER